MPQATPLPAALRQRVTSLVKNVGEKQAVAQLGIGRQTLARALAGLPLNTGTCALIRERLGEPA